MDPEAVDARAKQVQLGLFRRYGAFGAPLNASSCGTTLAKIYGAEFNATARARSGAV
jgi:hypothetical protein